METWIGLSWGMMVNEYTMALTGWVKGSVAAASAQLHTCLGWVLARINGSVVSTMQDVQEATADARLGILLSNTGILVLAFQ